MANDHPLHDQLSNLAEAIADTINVEMQKEYDAGNHEINPVIYVEALLVNAAQLIQAPLQKVEDLGASPQQAMEALDILMSSKRAEESMDKLSDSAELEDVSTMAFVLGALSSILPQLHGVNHAIYDEQHGIQDDVFGHAHDTTSNNPDDLEKTLRNFLNNN